ncbi:MAG: NADH pyrophosphatase [Peltula sp. TS41687]|nr:MAG: NADH pyrophosphatase [Peltula sp. TS41687]
MPDQPDLPEPAYPELDSMLSRRFGKEVANYFSGSPLNRVSFLRTDHHFLSAAVQHPTTSFLLFNNLAPLGKDPGTLAYVRHADVKPLIGDDPYSRTESQLIAEYNSSVTIPQLVFLGIDEKSKDGGLQWKVYRGAPYFALDVTPKGTVEKASQGIIAEMHSRGLTFLGGRLNSSLPASEAAIFAQARSFLDWNARNPFCGQCGQATLSTNGGAKRTCPPADLSALPTATAQGTGSANTSLPPTQRPPCATRHGVHNLSFPRTDPTIIVAVLNPTNTHVLLGRQKRWPPHWYSVLAGFIEPGESAEEACRREVWEESGVRLGRVVIQSTQPWPYPANLMIGAIAHTVPGGDGIVLEHDPELEDARWVEIGEVRLALEVGTAGLGEEPRDSRYRAGGLRLPPKTAIANRLLTAVVEGFGEGEGSKI